MRKMKKILAVALAAVMAIGVSPVANNQAAKAATASSVTITTADYTAAGTEAMSGDFDITYTFHNVSTGTLNHENYLLELRDADNNCIDVRADRYGWTWTVADGLVNFGDNTDVTITDYAWAEGATWDNFAATMQAGVDVTVNIVRKEDTFTITTDNTFAKFKYTVPFDMADDITVGLGGENVTLTNIVFTQNEITDDIVISGEDYTAASAINKSGDFDMTYTFHNVSNGTNNWDNYVIELRDTANNCIDVRSDAYGWTWTAATSTFTAFGDNADVVVATEWQDGYSFETNFASTMQAGVDVTVNIVRVGDNFVITTDNSICKFTYTIPFDMGDDVKVGLGGSNVTLSNFVVTDNNADGKYNMELYRSGATYTAPVKAGKVFAGWFTDSACTTPVAEDVTTGYAYAKFVDSALLSAKYQLSAGTTAESDSTNVRLMMAVDSLDYSKVGFKISYNGGAEQDVNSEVVYSGIKVTTSEGTTTDTPSTYFGATAKYMLPCAVRNVTDFDATISATPYWVTLDGTTVTGEAREFTVTDGLSA